jgi:hypothetical protein
MRLNKVKKKYTECKKDPKIRINNEIQFDRNKYVY